MKKLAFRLYISDTRSDKVSAQLVKLAKLFSLTESSLKKSANLRPR